MQTTHCRFCIFVLLFVFITSAYSQDKLPLIPYPNEVLMGNGKFQLSARTGIICQSSKANLSFLKDYLEEDFCLNLQERKGINNILLLENPENFESFRKEEYNLSVSSDTIKIEASTAIGIFYGIQTLRQLIDKETLSVSCLSINDKPNYSWRAFMLDESRYFKGKRVVKHLLDEMASLKMNIFHWHLTDDQGWRLEIKKYLKLTEKGAYRDSTQIGGCRKTTYNRMPHGGYYTQEDIREIVKYASERHITVVPEIEMPGHATAAVASYPWVGLLNNAIEVPCEFCIKSSVLNVADEKVMKFLHDVLQEVFSLFPAQVVHIGGDEIHFKEWESSKMITKFMKKHCLSNYIDLQLYFTNQMSHFIETNGKRMMGWNDIMGTNIHEWVTDVGPLSDKLSQNAIVQFWKGDTLLIREALEKGYDVVNSAHRYTYLDYDEVKLPLSKAYNFSPFPVGMDEKYRTQLLGLGCQMWCEWVPDATTLYRQVFPRLAAYAEVGWTKEENKDFLRFEKIVSSRKLSDRLFAN